MAQAVIVLSTVPKQSIGKLIANTLLEQKLCACVNIIDNINSIYTWQDKIEESHEILLIIKTCADKYSKLQKTIIKLHPYENPEIIMLDIKDCAPAYLKWIQKSLDN
jgi:periplasmic divalent cation tolerance protein